jgi:hypothetical protein
MRVATLAAVVVLSSACSSTSRHVEPVQLATVTGTFVGKGGPSPGVTVPLFATVRFRAADGHTTDAETSAGGRFSARLAPGHYTATALGTDGAPQLCSAPVDLDVTAGTPTDIRLSCAIP